MYHTCYKTDTKNTTRQDDKVSWDESDVADNFKVALSYLKKYRLYFNERKIIYRPRKHLTIVFEF